MTATRQPRRHTWPLLAVIAAAAFVADQVSKAWALRDLTPGMPRPLLGSVFQLVLIHLVGALVDERDGQALVEECHLLEALGHRVEIEPDGLENVRVRPEALGGAGAAGLLDLLQLLRHSHLEVLAPQVAITLDLGFHARGQGVNHRDAHAV